MARKPKPKLGNTWRFTVQADATAATEITVQADSLESAIRMAKDFAEPELRQGPFTLTRLEITEWEAL